MSSRPTFPSIPTPLESIIPASLFHELATGSKLGRILFIEAMRQALADAHASQWVAPTFEIVATPRIEKLCGPFLTAAAALPIRHSLVHDPFEGKSPLELCCEMAVRVEYLKRRIALWGDEEDRLSLKVALPCLLDRARGIEAYQKALREGRSLGRAVFAGLAAEKKPIGPVPYAKEAGGDFLIKVNITEWDKTIVEIVPAINKPASFRSLEAAWIYREDMRTASRMIVSPLKCKRLQLSNAISRDGEMPRLYKNFCPLCKGYATQDHEHVASTQTKTETRKCETQRLIRAAAILAKFSDPSVLNPSFIVKLSDPLALDPSSRARLSKALLVAGSVRQDPSILEIPPARFTAKHVRKITNEDKARVRSEAANKRWHTEKKMVAEKHLHAPYEARSFNEILRESRLFPN